MNKKLLHTVFEHQAFLKPDRLAIHADEIQWSYSQLNVKGNNFAAALKQQGVEKGNIVATLIPKSASLISCLLGIFKSGCVYLPLDPEFSRDRIRTAISSLTVNVLVVHEKYQALVKEIIDNLSSCSLKVVVVDNDGEVRNSTANSSELKSRVENPNPPVINQPEDGCYIVYTSGTTGTGKALLGCHQGLGHFIHWQSTEFTIDENYRVCFNTQITFDASFRDIFLPLANGSTLYIPAPDLKSNPLKMLQWVNENKIDIIHCVPSVFRMWFSELKNTGLSLPSIRFLFLAGEPLYANDIKQWRTVLSKETEIVNLYGTSETTMVKVFYRIKDDLPLNSNSAIPVGKPISNTIVAVLNDGIVCSPGEIGEVYIKTPFATKGYINEPELNKELFIQNPLVNDKEDIICRTGDLGRYNADGILEIVGRGDDQVKINGLRIRLDEVAAAIRCLTFINEAIVVSHKREDGDNELVCYYTGEKKNPGMLRDSLLAILDERFLPAYYFHMDRFPLTVNGKVDKKSLPRPEVLIACDIHYEPPQSDTERSLEDIFKEILRMENVSRSSSFFTLGGNSLKAMQVIARIYNRMNVEIAVSDMFKNPSIATLGKLVDQALIVKQEIILQVDDRQYYDATPGQRSIWLSHWVKKDLTAFNMPEVFRLKGKFKIDVFAKAVREIIQRHEMLRSTFHMVDGKLMFTICPTSDFNTALVKTDLQYEQDPESKASGIIESEIFFPIDLQKGPLIRFSVLKLTEHEFILVLNMHHIISDGWSRDIVVGDLITVYNHIAHGTSHNLAPLKIQFKDYATWQHNLLGGAIYQKNQMYWLQKLEGAIPTVQLPYDYNRPKENNYDGGISKLIISKSQYEAIQDLCVKQEATVFMFCMSVLNSLLYCHTGQSDILIAIPLAGRNQKELEALVGLFVNVLPARFSFQPEISFRLFFDEVKQSLLEDFSHQQYPFERILEDTGLKPQASNTPLYNVMAQAQDQATTVTEDWEMDDISVSPYSIDSKGAKFDFTFNFAEVRDTLGISVEYNSQLFFKSTAEKFIQDFNQAISFFLKNPNSTILDLRQYLFTGETVSIADPCFTETDGNDDF